MWMEIMPMHSPPGPTAGMIITTTTAGVVHHSILAGLMATHTVIGTMDLAGIMGLVTTTIAPTIMATVLGTIPIITIIIMDITMDITMGFIVQQPHVMFIEDLEVASAPMHEQVAHQEAV